MALSHILTGADHITFGFSADVQSINYPTVPVGEERLRITPTPGHTAEQMAHLIDSFDSIFTKLQLKRTSDWVAVGGRAGVGAPVPVSVDNVWTDGQLGLNDGSAPAMLRGGRKMAVEMRAGQVAVERMEPFLGKARIEVEQLSVSWDQQDAVAGRPLEASA